MVEVNGYTIEPGVDLTRADLDGANLSEANLRRAVADGRTVWPDDFDPDVAGVYEIGPGANLEGAYLELADLTGANLAGANLSEAHLTRANLRGANLSGVDLTGADLRRARANENTTWPEGFDPETAGVIFE